MARDTAEPSRGLDIPDAAAGGITGRNARGSTTTAAAPGCGRYCASCGADGGWCE